MDDASTRSASGARATTSCPMDDQLDDTGSTGLSDRFSFLDARSPSLRFALSD